MAEDARVDLTEEQAKLFALARAARVRVEAREGAAVVDETGRTYSGATVALPHLSMSAVGMAVATAAAAGAHRLAMCVVVSSTGQIRDADRDAFTDLAQPGSAIIVCRPDRGVVDRWTMR